MQPEIIPNIPDIIPKDYHQENEDIALEEFKKAKRKIMLFENPEGKLSVYFNKLDEVFYAGFVVSLSRSDIRVKNLYEYLKLCLEGTRSVIQCTKKGHLTAVKIEKHIKSKNEKKI